jgi:hypothetical protein
MSQYGLEMDPTAPCSHCELLIYWTGPNAFLIPFVSFIVRLIYIIIWYIDLLMKALCGVEEARVFLI